MTEKYEKSLRAWQLLKDKWLTSGLKEAKQRIVYCDEMIAYYKNLIQTQKLLDKLPQKS